MGPSDKLPVVRGAVGEHFKFPDRRRYVAAAHAQDASRSSSAIITCASGIGRTESVRSISRDCNNALRALPIVLNGPRKP